MTKITVCPSIIAVHGLGASGEWAWRWKPKADRDNSEKHVDWLARPDMLPGKIPDARILRFDYGSRWHIDAPKTRLNICGSDLLVAIHNLREDVSLIMPHKSIFMPLGLISIGTGQRGPAHFVHWP